MVPVITFLVLFFVTMIGFIGMQGQTIGASDTRVVSLEIDGEEQSIPTRAQTVGDLLERLEITVEEADIVEPAPDTPIDQDGLKISIYHARPVLLEEGGKKTLLYTAAPSPQAVAEEAGLVVYAEDRITASSGGTFEPTDLVNDAIVAERIVVERATPVKLNLYGVAYDIRSHAPTVRELMLERDIDFNQGSVFPALETPLSSAGVVFVTDPGKQITMVEEPIAQQQTFVDDFNLLVGRTEIRTAGSPGKKVRVYEVAPDGSKKVLQEVVVQEPVNQVIARGRKLNNIAVASDKVAIMSAAGIRSSDHYYADYIISHESGWRLGATNARGCIGLGQACPGGAKTALISSCPDWQTNGVCQMRYWTTYAVSRYGSWGGAFSEWQRKRWW